VQIQIRGVTATGVPGLDIGVTGLIARVEDGELRLYASSGRNGGLVSYQLDPGGALVVQSTVTFPAAIRGLVDDRVVLGQAPDGRPVLYVGCDQQGLIAYGLDDDLSLGGRLTVGWTQALAQAQAGGTVCALEALVTMSPRVGDLLPPGLFSNQIVSLRSVTVSDRDFVVIACAETDSIRSFLRDPATGTLIPADNHGALHGLGIHAPTALEVVTIGGVSYVVVASAGTSSLSVMRLTSDGGLVPVDHLLDTGTTRFEGAQAMAVAQSGDHTFVVVGGADHGVSLFLMLPDGRLVHLDTVADTAALSMANVASISAVVQGGQLHIFVGSQRDQGITHLTLPIDSLGVRRDGTPGQAGTVNGTAGADILRAMANGDTLDGGAGDDVLVSGPGRTVMRGGAGRDIFVVRETSTQVEILDFARGIDHLDLTNLPMLRSTGQLQFDTTADGARITYRGTVIVLRSADGQPLTLADLFPRGGLGPDRIPVLPREHVSEPGEEIFGTAGNDTIVGTVGSDTIWAGGGNDLITLIGGNDLVYGGAGNDTIVGSAIGNDTLYGAAGDDVIYAVGGDNWIGGGPGNDTIYGGSGNDLLWGADGNDVIHTGAGRNEAWGGAGNDTIYGGDGGNLMGGGLGDDVIYGGAGNDTIWGFHGNDLIHTGNGNNAAWGGLGNDTIQGGSGNDLLGGGPGNDLIHGGAGDDIIFAGTGNDTLFGGAGADTFVFYRGQDTNRIMDFNPAQGDVLQLARWLWGPQGNLTAAEVVARFARVDAAGNTILDFGAHGGTIIILQGFDDLAALVAQIDIV